MPSDPSITSAIATTAAALGGCLLLARVLDRHAEKLSVTEDPDNVGYFLDGPQGSGRGPAVALRALPSDDLPVCPDVIPEWMMEEFNGRPR